MPLVNNYSSTSEFEDEDSCNISDAKDSNPKGLRSKHIPASGQVVSTNNVTFSSLGSGTTKRYHFTKAELKAKRRKRSGSGPWGKWESSSDSDNNYEDGGIGSSHQYALDEGDFHSDDGADDGGEDIETSTFYGEKEKDYLGRGYLHTPSDIDINFNKEPLSFQCYLPKKIINVYDGHENGTTALKFLPKSGHLFLSGGNDNKLKIWDLYHDRRLLRDFCGHQKPIRDFNFTTDSKQFTSVSYDKFLKIWDTEKGAIIHRTKLTSVPNCVTFHPINNYELVVGLLNSEIKHYDTRDNYKNGLIQTYDHHTSSIIALKFFPNGSKFISSSEDKTIRIWDNQINIPIKQISDTAQHSMPWIEIHPEHNYFATQSMDNSIGVYSMKPKYKKHTKKIFKGHHSAGYGIRFDISPDGRYIASGDSMGRLFIWDWKTCRILKQFNAGTKDPLTNVAWNPQETSKVICSGNSGKIFLFD
ncbi:Cdc40p Ecym_5528 [Eremothecium cymbalariae DBVPG|uniref:Pre-mRNA-processing factor 17 n=1 Tax=Eremothecium cymbalariae (strain CBS 270.75 / DBVPG 7215 / KCTC 17166 / NRRL Y-17582) TaxID=931890 RepID=I6NDX7_ERECY|nr:hypothetical protein Ecym_5528 [Eremothecium cymbalariae DBVPG\